MTARPSLAKLAHTSAPTLESLPVLAVAEASDQAISPIYAPKVQKSREGKKGFTVFLAPELARAMRVFAVKNDRTLEDVTTEALNDLLRKYGEHPAA